MQVTVRLYRQHDMDLVGLYRTKDFKFQMHMKNALRAYAQNKTYRIEHPGDEDIRKGYVPKIVQIHIYLNPGKDGDSISMLKTIRTGYRGAFLKALFRKYLNDEFLDAYKDRKDLIFNAEEDSLEPKENAENFQNSRDNKKKSGDNTNNQKINNQQDKKTSGNNWQADKQKAGNRPRSEDPATQKQHNQQKPYGNKQENVSDKSRPENRDSQSRQNGSNENKRGNQNNNYKREPAVSNNGNMQKKGEFQENLQTKPKNEDIIIRTDTHSENRQNSSYQSYEHKQAKEPTNEGYSFFDRSAADEDIVWKENETKQHNEPARSTEADSQIPSSFFDNPDDDDTNDFLAQMRNLAH